MGPTTLICKLGLAALLTLGPSPATAQSGDAVNRYAAARLAEMGNRNDIALKGYTRLYRETPDSSVLADRIFDSAIRSGDMLAAVRAVRAQELRGEVSAAAPLLLYADAFTRKNWPMALLAAEELTIRSNFGFMAPILRSWVDVARGRTVDLPDAGQQPEPLLAYYSTDQRVYLLLATNDHVLAKQELRAIALLGGDYVRDLMLRSAPVIAAQGDQSFADALISTAMGPERDGAVFPAAKAERWTRVSANDGLTALHVRIATTLIDQNVNDQALILARLALQYSPDSEPAKLVVAKALDANGLGSQAAKLVETIDTNSPYWVDSVKWRVGRLDPASAVELARDAAAKRPKSPTLALLAAQAEEATGDFTSAAATYRSFIDGKPEGSLSPRQGALYRLMLAAALDNSGNWNAARQELDAALLLDPDNAQILNYLGYSMLERNEDIPRATAMIRKAYQAVPNSPAITDSMGWAHYQAGEYGEAVSLLEKAAKASGDDPAINEHLGDAYWQVGRLRDARYSWGIASQRAEGEAALRLAGKIDVGFQR